MPRRRNADHDDHAEQINKLLSLAQAMPHGHTRIELCEEAARVADLHNDPELAYRAREELIDAACFGGRPDLLIVGYSWCLAMFDKDRENKLGGGNISAYQLLWRMKWVIGALPKFPDIELKMIHGMLDDMERRFQDYGGSVQPVVGKRRMVALQTGNFEAAREHHRKFMKMSRSFLSDCHACELDALAGYWMDTGKNALGVRKAENLIASGMSCAKVPDSTYADVLLAMVKVGRARDAMAYHKKGYPLIRRNVGDLWHWGQHMAYLSLTGNGARAVKVLENHLADVEGCHDPLATLAFLRHMLVVVEGLAEKKDKAKLRLPAESPLANESGEYVLADLAKAIRARAMELSRRFDRRNGNGYYEEVLADVSALRKKAERVPYS